MSTSQHIQNNNKQNEKFSRQIRGAFGKTIITVSNISAPLIILKTIIDFQDLIDTLTENLFISSIALILFTAIFSLHLFSLRKLKTHLPSIRFKICRKSLFIYIGGLVSIAALILIFFLIFSVNVTGVYYVIIASAPNKQAAIHQVNEINQLLDNLGEEGLKAKTYDSGGENPWYSIVVGGAHFSKEAAQKTLERARIILRDRVDQGAWIKEYRFKIKG